MFHFSPGLAFCPGRLQPQSAALLQDTQSRQHQTDSSCLPALPAHCGRQTLLPSSSPGSMLCSGLPVRRWNMIPRKAPAMPAPALSSPCQPDLRVPLSVLLPLSFSFPALLPDPRRLHLACAFPLLVPHQTLVLEHEAGMATQYCRARSFHGRQLKRQTLTEKCPSPCLSNALSIPPALQPSAPQQVMGCYQGQARPPTQTKPSLQLGAPLSPPIPGIYLAFKLTMVCIQKNWGRWWGGRNALTLSTGEHLETALLQFYRAPGR